MPLDTRPIGLARSVFELFGVVLIRFRPLPRAWGAWLVAVNSACLFFLPRPEALVALVAVGAAVGIQALIYQRRRFVRVLGVAHVLWIPMLAWMAPRLAAVPDGESAFRAWLAALIATNAISLVIDAWDAARFARGERRPHYAW